MTNQHPITPPAELVQQWDMEGHHQDYCTVTEYVTAKTAQWGADQELEACCEWIKGRDWTWTTAQLRTARRPKPPSLKEQALLQLDTLNADLAMHGRGCDLSQIRRALEQLPND
jgi:hypothetical protein